MESPLLHEIARKTFEVRNYPQPLQAVPLAAFAGCAGTSTLDYSATLWARAGTFGNQRFGDLRTEGRWRHVP